MGQTIRAVHGTERRRAIAELVVIAGGQPVRSVLAEGKTIIGRDIECQFRLDNQSVSRRHCQLEQQSGKWILTDLQSACGTAVNGHFQERPCELTPGDEILLGGTLIRFELRYEAQDNPQQFVDATRFISKGQSANVLYQGKATEVIPLEAKRLSFGRSNDRDVILEGPLISGRHALLERSGQGDFLSDIQSATGTYINGKPIIRARLESGDRVQMGPYLFRYEGHRLVRSERSSAIGVHAVHVSKQVGTTTLLHDLTFSLQPGEFVGLLGPSGAGKTTLLDALNGLRPATAGDVLLNEDRLYDDYALLRHHIGYVPQDDIIHRELTVRQALMFAAKLRLPTDMHQEELQHVVDETLDIIDLSHRGDVPISQLSGGQRKRVSIGVELLSRPGVLFLDEPTSGLDPGTEARMMRLFRRLADQGRTVVCTTHVMENIDLFHKVVILARGGRLAYFGPPGDAKAFFGIEKFSDLYDRMEAESPEHWQAKFQKSKQYGEFIAPLEKRHQKPERRTRPKRLPPAPGVSTVQQTLTLMNRFITLQWADKVNLGLLLLQPVLITALICMVCKELPMINFLLVISALWFGCSGAAQQIVRERPIYRRERMVNLRLASYLLSKWLPLMLLSTVQAVLMLSICWLMEDWQGSFGWTLVALILAAWNGLGIGLLISSVASNADKAMSVVPLTLIPQIILAGVLVPLPDMNTATDVASCLAAARWANQACEVARFEDDKIEAELIQEENLRSLWNLYPHYEMKTPQGQQDFLVDYAGRNVERSGSLAVDYGLLAAFLLVMGLGSCAVLKSQDTL